MHRVTTHMFPAGQDLHPNEPNDERHLLRRASAAHTDRALSDCLRSPRLAPERHLHPERERLPFRRRRA